MGDNSITTLELGLRAETRGMAADVIFTTTNLVESTQPPGDDKGKEDASDRSMFNPWLVVVLLTMMLIIGAVARDLIHNAIKKKREKSEPKEVAEEEKVEDQDNFTTESSVEENQDNEDTAE